MAILANGKQITLAGLHDTAVENALRRWQYGKTFDNPDGTRTYIVRGKSVHYQDGTDWQEINPTLVVGIYTGGYAYASTHNRFHYLFAADYGATWPVLMRVGTHRLPQKLVAVGHLDHTTKVLTALQTAQAVGATISGATIRYNGVFAGVDVEYVIDHDYAKQNIYVSESAKLALRNAIIAQGLDTQGWLVMATRLNLSTLGTTLDILADQERDGRIGFADEVMGWFPTGVAWDENGQRTNMRWRYVNHQTYGPLLLSALPLAWLATSQGMVTIDPTNYYASTTDGHIRGSGADYNTARSTSGFSETGQTWFTVGQWYYPTTYEVYRVFLEFNTAGITNSDAVKQVKLWMEVQSDYSDTNLIIRVHQYAWTSPIDAGNREANYDGALASTYDADWRNSADGLVADTYYGSSNLDPTWVSKTGITQYALLSNRDVNNSAPTDSERVDIHSADNADTTSDPYLAITTITAPTGCTNTVVNPTQVDVAWTDTSTGEDGFNVERSDNGGAYAEVNTPAADAQSWSDTTVTPNNTYQYRVRARTGSLYTGYATATDAVGTWAGFACLF